MKGRLHKPLVLHLTENKDRFHLYTVTSKFALLKVLHSYSFILYYIKRKAMILRS